MIERKARFSRPLGFLWLLRLNRTVMVAMITGRRPSPPMAGCLKRYD